MLNFNSILLFSENPQRLAEFYKQVVGKDPVMEQDGYCTLEAGACYLTFGPHDKVSGKSTNPERIMMNFEAEDVQAEFDRVKAIAGATVIKDPEAMDEENKYFIGTLADPDGNYLQIVSPFDADAM